MEEPIDAAPRKEAYEKPELRKVTLAAEEVAAAGCKNMGAMGPTGSSCSTTMCLGLLS